jgi:hypothetical protein
MFTASFSGHRKQDPANQPDPAFVRVEGMRSETKDDAGRDACIALGYAEETGLYVVGLDAPGDGANDSPFF